uniref:Uncharacterized protein n=1 Tax=Morchella importuna TaxID=1174673 RepID=A0A650AFA5_9PEZI|nr:hypothetical protein [Morchella importuna]QGN66716.1 hypothetical protein [Morchella importuna]
MWIVGNKPGEFQERLVLSQLEAKHHLIFDPVVYLVIIRCIRVYLIMRSSWAPRPRTLRVGRPEGAPPPMKRAPLFIFIFFKKIKYEKVLNMYVQRLVDELRKTIILPRVPRVLLYTSLYQIS